MPPIRAPFSNNTNIIQAQEFNALFRTPSQRPKGKRRVDENVGLVKAKRLKLEKSLTYGSPEKCTKVDIPQNNLTTPRTERRRGAMTYNALKSFALGQGSSRLRQAITTRATLKTFVSSKETDIFKCQSTSVDSFLTIPYACSFSHGAKSGRENILAVATEQGTIEIFDTGRREPWSTASSHTVIPTHQNGIFDVQWSFCDSLLACGSGDQSVSITNVERQATTAVLRGHLSTPKCIAWDPNNPNLLSSAGRDGCICLWDLRADSRTSQSNDRPVLVISGAHEPLGVASGRRKKPMSPLVTVTSLVYLPYSQYHLLSSGSSDGILRKWDVRSPDESSSPKRKKQPINLIEHSTNDPTTFQNTHRGRGISSLALGRGPTEAMLFGLSNDSKIHTYNAAGAAGVPLSIPQSHDIWDTYEHEAMVTNSFYVKIAASPCGRWLASGSSKGSVFLFDIGARDRNMAWRSSEPGVELNGQMGEVGALDWAEGQLATCADDGTVRIWRPDYDVHLKCIADPEEAKWSWNFAV